MALAAALLVVLGVTGSSRAAPGGDDLKTAERRASQLRAELDQAASAYQAAYGRLVLTRDRLEGARTRRDGVALRMDRTRAALAIRAREAYKHGPAGPLELLLSASSMGDLTARAEFLQRISQGESDLVVRAEVLREELTRTEDDLSSLASEQADAVSELDRQRDALETKLAEAQALEESLRRQLAAQRDKARAGSPPVIVSGGALQACPVNGPRAVGDDYGVPRPGGRTHQGNDIFAPRGTPVVAAQGGRLERHPNSLGGNASIVYASNGDYTYYAHMDSYAAGDGVQVGAGTLIGTVGDTGNARGTPTHLHFEYHPGGGGAIDPHPYLLAVC